MKSMTQLFTSVMISAAVGWESLEEKAVVDA